MLEVTCAIIIHDGKVLATQRSKSMKMPLKWEFPGGKLEDNEIASDGLKREIKEELAIDIRIIKPLPTIVHHYTSFSISLIPFVAEYVSGEIKLTEHAAYLWLDSNNIPELDWAEADLPLVRELHTIVKQAIEPK
ncbi:MAG: (deoxy)nucleoside triphosphate pyrophosphohydrolase [Flavobacteriales bacterium]